MGSFSTFMAGFEAKNSMKSWKESKMRDVTPQDIEGAEIVEEPSRFGGDVDENNYWVSP